MKCKIKFGIVLSCNFVTSYGIKIMIDNILFFQKKVVGIKYGAISNEYYACTYMNFL